jgi:hypothetical protein
MSIDTIEELVLVALIVLLVVLAGSGAVWLHR